MTHPDGADPAAVGGAQPRPFLSLPTLRAGSGLVLFCFIAMHLINHALLLVSLRQAEMARAILAAPWRTLGGTVLLYGAVAIHLVLTLLALYRRQTLVMPPVEFLRLVLGLLIPYFIVEHAVSTRLSLELYGEMLGYADVVRSLWITSPANGIQQGIALVVVWVHGCIGISFLIRHNSRWRPWIPLLLAMAVLLPTLALLGFAMTGRSLALQRAFPAIAMLLYPPEIERLTRVQIPTVADRGARLAMISTTLRIGYICLVAGIMVLRELRLFHMRVHSISIRYAGGETVRVAPGASVLEASRANGIPHYGICGGNARCSTCRVRVTSTAGPLPPPGPAEQATLTRIHAGPDVRLACQLRPRADLGVSLLLQPSAPEAQEIESSPVQSPREREIAVLFCDLRGFTKYSESRLPYDVVFLLNRYFVIVGEAVTSAGGRVDKFIGDGAMALFGFETGPQEACRSALAAAEAILRGMARMNEELGSETRIGFDIAIGIHFGPAVVGVMGYGATLSETAIGDTVNVASRLETLAKQEEMAVAVSADVLTHAEVRFDGAALRSLPVRGRRSEVSLALLTDHQLSDLLLAD